MNRPDQDNDRIGGRYPGGPSREGDDSEARRTPDLPGAEEMDAWRVESWIRRKKKKRRQRVLVGTLFSALLAGLFGFWLGTQSQQTAEDLAAQRQAETRGGGWDPIRERQHVLHELWKMEDFHNIPHMGSEVRR